MCMCLYGLYICYAPHHAHTFYIHRNDDDDDDGNDKLLIYWRMIEIIDADDFVLDLWI